MNEIWRYSIRVQGHILREDFNRTSPVGLVTAQIERTQTICAVEADQAALIGLLRHMHQRGIAILAMNRLEMNDYEGECDD